MSESSNNNLSKIKSTKREIMVNLDAGEKASYQCSISDLGFTTVYGAVASYYTNPNMEIVYNPDNSVTDRLTFAVTNRGTSAYNGGIYPFIIVFGK